MTRGDAPVAIKPKALDTLIALIENRHRVVDKDELMAWLWPDTFVEEANLSQNVFVIRKALGEVPGEHRFIDTVARRGYRFVADVAEVLDEVDAPPEPSEGPPVPTTVSDERAGFPWPSVRMWIAMAVLVATLAGLFAAARSNRQVAASPIRSIAVLPLRDLSAGTPERYLADSLTDALITDLGSISSLQVTARTSAIRFRESALSLPEIARTLGVDALVDGTFGIGDGRIRLTTRLLDGPSGTVLWSEEFEVPVRQLRALEGRVAQAVATAVRAEVTEGERRGLSRRQPVDPDAYDLYLRARYYWSRRGPDDVRRSIDFYRQSIALDPTFAAAHGGLALVHCLTADALPASQVYGSVRAAATAALAIDPEQPDALVALTQATVLGDRDWRDGLHQFERILARYPNFENAIGWNASLLADLGRTDEALRLRERSVELDPWSLSANNSLGLIYSRVGRYDEAVRHFRRGLEIDSAYADTRAWLGWTLVHMGRVSDGIAESEEAVRISKHHPRMVARLAHVYAIAGRPADARRLLADLERRARSERVAPLFLAHIHAGLGEADKAFARLDEAYGEDSPVLQRIRSDPQLESLHADPRFGVLVQRLGLPWP